MEEGEGQGDPSLLLPLMLLLGPQPRVEEGLCHCSLGGLQEALEDWAGLVQGAAAQVSREGALQISNIRVRYRRRRGRLTGQTARAWLTRVWRMSGLLQEEARSRGEMLSGEGLGRMLSGEGLGRMMSGEGLGRIL